MTMKKKITIAATVLTIAALLRGVQITSYNEVVSKFVENGFTTKLFIALIAVNAAYIVIDTACRICGKITRVGITNSIKLKLMERVINSPIGVINKTPVGVVNNLVAEISATKAALFVSCTFTAATSIPFIAAMIKLAEHPIMIIILLVCTAISGMMYFFSERLFKFSEKESSAAAVFNAVSIDGLENLKTVKFISKGRYVLDKASEAEKDAYKYAVSIPKRLWEALACAIMTVPTVIQALIFRDDVATMTYMFVNEWTLYNTLTGIVDIIDMVIKIKADEKLLSDLDGSDTAPKVPMPSEVKVFGQFTYSEDSPTFIVDVTIKRCERYLVTGESGQGKSSFGNVLAGLIKSEQLSCPDNLDVYYTHQETGLLNSSLRENITFYDESITDEEIRKLFENLNMIDWLDSLKEGLDTIVGEKAYKLSSGQKQRVNIIRAILEMRRSPNKLFILDEITSNLDAETRDLAIKLIDRECHSTLILISHNEGFDKICDHHIHVVDHKILEQ